MARIDVVMATYNGGAFIDEMLASVQAQDWPGLRLIVCDDGSTDDTVNRLKRFAIDASMPVQIVCNERNLGARDNFAKALSLADADYIALADQDDVWLPGKIALMVEALHALEEQYGTGIPALVYSDLQIVDGELRILSGSYFDGTFKSRNARSVADFCMSNHVPGCAMLLNRRLVELAMPVPHGSYMHDWWLCLVAAAAGRIAHVEQPLLLFRRHGLNATDSGAQKHRSGWIRRALGRARTPFRYVSERWRGTERLAAETNERLTLIQGRLGANIHDDAKILIKSLTSRRWRDRYLALRDAHSGDSSATELLVSLQMGRVARRTPSPTT